LFGWFVLWKFAGYVGCAVDEVAAGSVWLDWAWKLGTVAASQKLSFSLVAAVTRTEPDD